MDSIKQESPSNDEEIALFNLDDIADDILSLNQSDDSFRDSDNTVQSMQESSAEQQTNSVCSKQTPRNRNKSVLHLNQQRIRSFEGNMKSLPSVEPIEIEIRDCKTSYDNNYIVKYLDENTEISVLVIYNRKNNFKRTVIDLFVEQHKTVFQDEELLYFEAFHPHFRSHYTVTQATLPGQGLIYMKKHLCKKRVLQNTSTEHILSNSRFSNSRSPIQIGESQKDPINVVEERPYSRAKRRRSEQLPSLSYMESDVSERDESNDCELTTEPLCSQQMWTPDDMDVHSKALESLRADQNTLVEAAEELQNVIPDSALRQRCNGENVETRDNEAPWSGHTSTGGTPEQSKNGCLSVKTLDNEVSWSGHISTGGTPEQSKNGCLSVKRLIQKYAMNIPNEDVGFQQQKHLSNTITTLREHARKLENYSKAIAEDLNILEQILKMKPTEDYKSVCPTSITFQPASNLAELDAILEIPSLKQMLMMCFGRNENVTCTNMIKKLMTKELAQTFSLTGMGMRRKHIKNSFKDHPAATVVIGCATRLHPGCSQKELLDSVRKVFKGVLDWKGGRTMRKHEKSQTNQANLNGDPATDDTGVVHINLDEI